MQDPRPQAPLDEVTAKLLLSRAERLRERPAEEAQDVFWAAEFPLGAEAYALPLECLVACQPLRLVTPVPLSDTRLTGVVRFQRRLLSVMSLSGMLGSPGWKRDPSVMLVLKLDGEHLVAVDCEEIPRTSSLPLKALEEARRKGNGASVLLIERPGQGPLHLIETSGLFGKTRSGSGHGK